ncbi:GAF and ANTAR domain-containing protein [Streptomyces monomycini]|uniref:GAF and ANTAR domain-containing protein n=1 Tax=Streptomyces monomycini TaxID=371720 RepID=UPI0004AB7387|nr:GAF and ANTAR domain-containing protein [Streptomyces monomycini]
MAREEPLTQVWADLPEGLVGDVDCGELLSRLCAHCAALFGTDAAAVLLADAHHRLRVVAESGDTARLLGPDGPQDACDPYDDCYRSGTAETDIALSDPRTAARWPHFTALARERGHVTAHALPMRLRSRTVGVLALFSGTAAPLGEQDGAFVRSLADLLAVTAVQCKSLERSHAERTQLQHALSSRVVIEQAKGMLAERWTTTVDEAFTVFRAYARAHRRRLPDLARQVVDGTLDSGLVMEYFLNRR